MKINKIYLPVLFFSCVALGIVIGGLINYPVAQSSFSKNNYKSKLNSLINFIDNEYVDDVQTDSIVDLTVTNILSNLDPHSVYIPKSDQKVPKRKPARMPKNKWAKDTKAQNPQQSPKLGTV